MLPDMCCWYINNNIRFHYKLFPRKTNMTKFFKKSQKPHFGPFCPILGQKWIFREKRVLSVFQYSNYLPLCQKSEKPNEPLLRKLLDGHTKNQFVSLIFCEIQPILESCDWLKNPAIWLAKSILSHISGTRIFPNMKFVQAYKNYSNYRLIIRYRPNW